MKRLKDLKKCVIGRRRFQRSSACPDRFQPFQTFDDRMSNYGIGFFLKMANQFGRRVA